MSAQPRRGSRPDSKRHNPAGRPDVGWTGRRPRGWEPCRPAHTHIGAGFREGLPILKLLLIVRLVVAPGNRGFIYGPVVSLPDVHGVPTSLSWEGAAWVETLESSGSR